MYGPTIELSAQVVDAIAEAVASQLSRVAPERPAVSGSVGIVVVGDHSVLSLELLRLEALAPGATDTVRHLVAAGHHLTGIPPRAATTA